MKETLKVSLTKQEIQEHLPELTAKEVKEIMASLKDNAKLIEQSILINILTHIKTEARARDE